MEDIHNYLNKEINKENGKIKSFDEIKKNLITKVNSLEARLQSCKLLDSSITKKTLTEISQENAGKKNEKTQELPDSLKLLQEKYKINFTVFPIFNENEIENKQIEIVKKLNDFLKKHHLNIDGVNDYKSINLNYFNKIINKYLLEKYNQKNNVKFKDYSEIKNKGEQESLKYNKFIQEMQTQDSECQYLLSIYSQNETINNNISFNNFCKDENIKLKNDVGELFGKSNITQKDIENKYHEIYTKYLNKENIKDKYTEDEYIDRFISNVYNIQNDYGYNNGFTRPYGISPYNSTVQLNNRIDYSSTGNTKLEEVTTLVGVYYEDPKAFKSGPMRDPKIYAKVKLLAEEYGFLPANLASQVPQPAGFEEIRKRIVK